MRTLSETTSSSLQSSAPPVPAALDTPPVPASLDTLPVEVFARIIACNSLQDIRSLACASRKLCEVTVSESSFSNCLELKTFIKNILSTLDDRTRAEQKTSLERILKSLSMQFPNLIEVKKYLLSIKHQISDVLMTLTQEELSAIRRFPTPIFCMNIVIVSEDLSKALNPSANPKSILEIARNCIGEDKDFSWAIKMMDHIHDDVNRGNAFLSLVQIFIRMENNPGIAEIEKKIIAIARKTQEEKHIKDLVTIFIILKKYTKAIEIADKCSDPRIRIRFFLSIASSLGVDSLASETILKAIELVDTLPNQTDRRFALLEISRALAKTQDVIGAIEFATRFIEDQKNIDSILKEFSIVEHIYSALKDLKDSSQATKIVNDIQHEPLRKALQDTLEQRG